MFKNIVSVAPKFTAFKGRMEMTRMLENHLMPLKMVFMLSCMAIITIGCGFMTGIYEDEPRSKPVVVAESSKIISPEDFKVLIIGKTKKEVREIMGRSPDVVMDLGEGIDQWSYFRKITPNGKFIHDPDVGKNADRVDVVFRNGKAERPMVEY